MTENAEPAQILAAAKWYAKHGWAVFPVGPNKTPLTARGFKDASADNERIHDLFEGGGAGVAVATGAVSGIVVLDVDPDHRGHESLAELESLHGDLPQTPRARTGSGGWHYYFRWPGRAVRNSASKLGGGLDIRGDGGYVVAPPSTSYKGSYSWEVKPTECELAELPEWILEQSKPATISERVSVPGSRNVELTSLAGSLRRMGLDESGIGAALLGTGTTLPEEEVRRIAQSVSRYEPDPYPLSDAGQAELLRDLNKGRLVYDRRRRTWFTWAGHWWTEDNSGRIIEAIISAARHRGIPESQDQRRFALLMESRNKIEAVEKLAQSYLGVPDPEIWDSDPYLLGVLNGIIDLRTGRLSDGVPEQYVTKHAAVNFTAGAGAPRWIRFIQEIFDNNEEIGDYIHRACGYSFTGLTGEQCWFLCYGRGANGKSTFLGTLRHIAGDYGHNARVSTFTRQNNRGEANADIAELKGTRYVIASEAGNFAELDQERIKSLIGSEGTRARHLYSSSFEFHPTLKLWLANNYRPRVSDDSHGFWRRIRLIPFEKTFTPTDDPGLEATLKAETEGILAWVVEGAQKYFERGLRSPNKIAVVTKEYEEENDLIGQFLHETTNDGGTVGAKALYDAYRQWARAQGIPERSMMRNQSFGMAIGTRLEKKTRNGSNFYIGVTLKEGEGQLEY